ncbi:MAG: hypothetical protein QW818_02335 [Candidatus Aenigmatarchaeota archaeon]|nr:hypothetical protein [Candidatus Aenigmarchaeota archaeon]
MEKVSCDICNRKFKTNEALKQHKNDAHKQASAVSQVEKKKISKGKLFAIVIPIVIFGLIGYAIYWALTTESIGTLGSTHIHADFAIFLNGKKITPLPEQYYVASPYIHVEAGPGAGSVIHMHATNVPLKMFFNSLGMKLTSKCFEINKDNKYCNDGVNTLKMFVKHVNGTWEQNFEYEKYVFKDLDKILITYGNETDEEIQLQQNNVTDFAKDNSGRSMVLRR